MYERYASSLSSATYAAMQHIRLSLTKAPIGSASAIAFLYEPTARSAAAKSPTEKPSTPRPLCAAISYDEELPAAYHMGGCGLTYGLGRILRGGSCQNLPW